MTTHTNELERIREELKHTHGLAYFAGTDETKPRSEVLNKLVDDALAAIEAYIQERERNVVNEFVAYLDDISEYEPLDSTPRQYVHDKQAIFLTWLHQSQKEDV
jgi:hypothetical protein